MQPPQNQVPIARKLRWRRDIAVCVAVGAAAVCVVSVIIATHLWNGALPTVEEFERQLGLWTDKPGPPKCQGIELEPCRLMLDLTKRRVVFTAFRNSEGKTIGIAGEFWSVPVTLTEKDQIEWRRSHAWWYTREAEHLEALNRTILVKFAGSIEQVPIVDRKTDGGVIRILRRASVRGLRVEVSHIRSFGAEATDITVWSVRGPDWDKYVIPAW